VWSPAGSGGSLAEADRSFGRAAAWNAWVPLVSVAKAQALATHERLVESLFCGFCRSAQLRSQPSTSVPEGRRRLVLFLVGR
jgi:hypothetical protein